MKLLSNTQFYFLNNEHFFNTFVVVLKSLLILLCGLFPFFLRYFKYFKTFDEEQPLFEDEALQERIDFNEIENHLFEDEALQERIDFDEIENHLFEDEALQERIYFDEIENPFSDLTFRFPTYEEFLKTKENVDSNEKYFLEQHCSIPSSPDPDFTLNSREGSENLPPNDLDCTNDVGIEDDFVDSIETNKFKNEEDSEDDDLLEALQIQIMKAKANAKAKSVLPSIPEETDYSITTNENDLKPWKKKEESFNHRDLRKELHRFHKQYTEKMRKYDILNRQKTYAKELKMMQSKESVESVLTKGFCVCKGEKRTGENREIDGEMEMVYVVQLWVSWEFIVWEYKKALEIYGREGYGSCRFNGVAEEFEHFKVMIQRFMENEKFDEGSRVECYVRSRLVRRKLLQVPLLKEDEVTGVFEEDDKENTVTIYKLINILQESIRMLWQFIRKDKLIYISTNLKCHLEAKQGCISPSHSKIQTQILLDLQKRERKLKKIVKRKKCMLKNCKEELEEDEPIDDEVCFLTMVDLKLVSRMLNMKKITRKQLSWCHHKLSCITFPNGKIKIHSSSFLFSSS